MGQRLLRLSGKLEQCSSVLEDVAAQLRDRETGKGINQLP